MTESPKLIICPCLCDSNNNDDGSCIRDFIVLDNLIMAKDGGPFGLENHVACRYYKCRVNVNE